MKKKAEAIYVSVMADAPEWLTPEELPAAKNPTASTPRKPAQHTKAPADRKSAMRAKLKGMVGAGKITPNESMELYLAAFPEEEANAIKMRSGENIAKLIQIGKFDKSPFDALDLTLTQTNPKVRGSALSAAFGRLAAGVGGVELDAVVERLESLVNARDRNFAINGLATDWSPRIIVRIEMGNSTSNERLRRTVVENVTADQSKPNGKP